MRGKLFQVPLCYTGAVSLPTFTSSPLLDSELRESKANKESNIEISKQPLGGGEDWSRRRTSVIFEIEGESVKQSEKNTINPLPMPIAKDENSNELSEDLEMKFTLLGIVGLEQPASRMLIVESSLLASAQVRK